MSWAIWSAQSFVFTQAPPAPTTVLWTIDTVFGRYPWLAFEWMPLMPAAMTVLSVTLTWPTIWMRLSGLHHVQPPQALEAVHRDARVLGAHDHVVANDVAVRAGLDLDAVPLIAAEVV